MGPGKALKPPEVRYPNLESENKVKVYMWSYTFYEYSSGIEYTMYSVIRVINSARPIAYIEPIWVHFVWLCMPIDAPIYTKGRYNTSSLQ